MSDSPSPQWGARPQNVPPARKRRRIFPWVFLAVQALFVIWISVGVNTAGDSNDCSGLTGDALQLCRDAGNAGTAIGVGLVIALWVAADVILGISYLVFRLSRKDRT
ncbi:hypothetical protein [Streptomyces sp. NPDC003015]